MAATSPRLSRDSKVCDDPLAFSGRFAVAAAEMGALDTIPADDADRPDFVVLHPAHGVVVVEHLHERTDFDETVKSLNRKVAALRTEFREIEDLPLQRVVVLDTESGAAEWVGQRALMVPPRIFGTAEWVPALRTSEVDSGALTAFGLRMHPAMQFAARGRTGAEDPGASDRRQVRIVLDEIQAATASCASDGVTVITGPPGSGKTLMLVARARWLATVHPEWSIQIVVFNRLLVRHLTSMVAGYENIEVLTFAAFSAARGHRLSFDDEAVAARDLATARRAGITRDIDALLVDEWQDFDPSWIAYCLDTLRPGCGGAMFAGDAHQALYRDRTPDSGLGDREVEWVELERPYRSTRQVLEFVAQLDPSFTTAGSDLAPEGEPVDLIAADSWDAQAQAIAWEVTQMLASGQRVPGDIGILAAQRRSVVRRLEDALTEAGIPFEVLSARGFGLDAPPSDDAVSVITVHSAKGYEFDVVLLMGIEALPPSGDDVEKNRRARVGYVGTTRARDQLFVTYTRPNTLVSRLRGLGPELLRTWTYPDDYEGV